MCGLWSLNKNLVGSSYYICKIWERFKIGIINLVVGNVDLVFKLMEWISFVKRRV